MTIEMMPSFDQQQQQQFHITADPSFHQANMAAAAGSAAAAQASSHHLNYPTTTVNQLNGYFTHPYYQQHQQHQQQNYHPLLDPYHSDFRPTFYNPFEIKHRRRTSRAQLKVLEKSFLENAKPNASVRRYLAQELEMTPRGVQIWFQNRRAKAKLQKRKSQQQQQLSPTMPIIDTTSTTNTASNNSNTAVCLMTSTPSSASAIHSSSSLSPSVSAAGALFYPLDDIRSTTTATHPPTFMPDQSWLAMPMHPLSSPSSAGVDNTILPQQEPRRQSCPLLSNTSPLYDQADVLSRRVSSKSFSPATSNTVTNGLTWMTDSTDTGSCCSSTNGSGSSHCDTPGWSLDTFASVNQHSPLTDPSLFDLYQQSHQQQQLCLKPENVNTAATNTTNNNALNLYTAPVSTSSPSLSHPNYQTATPSLMSALL